MLQWHDCSIAVSFDRAGKPLSDTRGWDKYWTGSSSGAAFNQEGADHPALDEFWIEALAGVDKKARILDVASGRGALLAHLPSADYEQLVSLDYSLAAMVSQRTAYPFVLAVSADVKQLPFLPASFDHIVSQFGVEYGGLEAVDSLADYVAPGGRIDLILHGEGSLIEKECHANLAALKQLQTLGFLPLAEAMFTAGYKVLKGEGDRGAAGEAARKMLEPFRGVGQLLEQYGEGVAGGTLLTLYRETARIQERIQHHVEDEVIGWLQTMDSEVNSYMERMQSMSDAALSESEFRDRVSSYQSRGISCSTTEPLQGEQGELLGWVLSGERHD